MIFQTDWNMFNIKQKWSTNFTNIWLSYYVTQITFCRKSNKWSS